MDIRNGSVYENNFARAAAGFLGTCAPAPAGGERLAACRLVTGIYAAIAGNAAAIGFRPVPDVSFAPWEKQKGREKDIKDIRGAIDKVNALVSELFLLAESAEILADGALLPAGARVTKPLKAALSAAGAAVRADGDRVRLSVGDGCFAGLKELAAVSRANTVSADRFRAENPSLYFSRCVFEPSDNWLAPAFDRMLGADGRLVWLCGELEKRGYRRAVCRDGKASLDYVRQHGKKEEMIKDAWAERTHSGIGLTYEDLRLEPCFLWLRMPMFKTVLECGQKLPANVAGFIGRFTKTCDGCRYCVQTDKTGTRPLACLELDGVKKCPLFPGFSMNWRRLPPELAEAILSALDALDTLPELA